MAALAEKSDTELIHELLDAERALIGARMKHSMSQLENTSQLKELRRAIARMHTEARRREIEQGLKKDALIHAHRQSYAPGEGGSDEEGADKGGFLSGIVDKLAGQD